MNSIYDVANLLEWELGKTGILNEQFITLITGLMIERIITTSFVRSDKVATCCHLLFIFNVKLDHI